MFMLKTSSQKSNFFIGHSLNNKKRAEVKDRKGRKTEQFKSWKEDSKDMFFKLRAHFLFEQRLFSSFNSTCDLWEGETLSPLIL